ncbi:MAG: ComEC/Rec2 family competence protein [Candidatus Shapirobacteria bacterium]|nr:ComEC/Rec2 family competence protein [Candidatus Shapirobacteria bacterium]
MFEKKQRQRILFLGLSVVFLLTWLWRFWSVNNKSQEKFINVEGIIWDEPNIFYSVQRFWLKGYLIETSTNRNLSPGDRVLISGNQECQLIGKYQKRCSINYPDISVKKDNIWSTFIRITLKLRTSLIASLERLLPSEPASLLTGVVWGNQGQFSKRFYDDMRASGLLHVVVASGANVLSLVMLLKKTGRFLGRQLVITFSLPVIVIYGFIVGNDPPIVRAVLMSGLVLVSQLVGRPINSFRNLFLAGEAMMIVDPLIFLDVGFQLSFGASLGILLFNQRFKKIFRWSDLATTLAAQTMTTPLLALHFNSFSPFSFLSNACLLWLIEPLMLWGLGLTFLGLISQSLAGLLALFFWPPLQVFIWGGHFWAQTLFSISVSERMALISLIIVPLAWFLLKISNKTDE